MCYRRLWHLFQQAKKVWEAAMKALKEEESNKQNIFKDLNQLGQDSAFVQYSWLEELKKWLEALNPQPQGVASESDDIRIGIVAPDNRVISIGTLSQQPSNGSGNVASSISVNLLLLRDQSPSSKPTILPHDKKVSTNYSGMVKVHLPIQWLKGNLIP